MEPNSRRGVEAIFVMLALVLPTTTAATKWIPTLVEASKRRSHFLHACPSSTNNNSSNKMDPNSRRGVEAIFVMLALLLPLLW
ncbi:hypothetical protein EAE99_009624 [Botrytis elliptica]|nr:hypothetical protein EAE99_009624 [Botrytis elliptica]